MVWNDGQEESLMARSIAPGYWERWMIVVEESACEIGNRHMMVIWIVMKNRKI